MEDQAQELKMESDDSKANPWIDAAEFAEKFGRLRGRMQELLDSEGQSAEWFAMWSPVVRSSLGLAKTLFKLITRLRRVGESDESLEPPDDDLRQELADDLRDIAEDFPDVADTIFGLQHLDDLIDRVAEDASARAMATALAESAGRVIDRTVRLLIDIALDPQKSTFGADAVLATLARYEDFAQRLLDDWLMPRLFNRHTDEVHDDRD